MNRTIKGLLLANMIRCLLMTGVILVDLIVIHQQGAIQAIIVSVLLLLLAYTHYKGYLSLNSTTAIQLHGHIIFYLIIELLIGYSGLIGVISRVWFDNGGYAVFG